MTKRLHSVLSTFVLKFKYIFKVLTIGQISRFYFGEFIQNCAKKLFDVGEIEAKMDLILRSDKKVFEIKEC